MSEKLVSGLYKQLNQIKENNSELSKAENKFIIIVNGLVDFVKNNPDLTNSDIKLLASTDKEQLVYFDVIFEEFPNVVEEIKKNGSINIISLFNQKYKDGRVFDNLTVELDSMIKNETQKHRFELKFYFRKQHRYDYFYIEFKKIFKGKCDQILYSHTYKSSFSSGTIQYTSDVSLREVCQIVAFVKFYEKTKLSENTIRDMINSNLIYDFSVIKTILNHRSSIEQDMNNGIYGIWNLFKDYEHYKIKEKENTKSM